MRDLEPDITLEGFRQEMQHRVVRYPVNSRPVKEALRFAKRHHDPAFYRIASDKVHAQQQYQRELYGPSRMEKLVDFFALGSLREVVVTLTLVAAGVVGLDIAKRIIRADPDEELYSQMDVDALATRLGLALETSQVSVPQRGPIDQIVTGVAKPDEPFTGLLSEADVVRIADAVMKRLDGQPHPRLESRTDNSNLRTTTVDATSEETPTALAVVPDSEPSPSEQVQ